MISLSFSKEVKSRDYGECLKNWQLQDSRSKRKCELFKTWITHLSYIVSNEGIDPRKIAAIVNWPTPVTVRDVKAFWDLLIIIGALYIATHILFGPLIS